MGCRDVALREAVRRSSLYRTGERLQQWGRGSVLIAALVDERVQHVLVGTVLLVSIVSVHLSSMDASVKFLSFVAMFAVVGALVWSLADPFGDGEGESSR